MTHHIDTTPMNEQYAKLLKQRPVYVRYGDWYILHQGKSEIKAFGDMGIERTVVYYSNSEIEVNQSFPDFCDRMREVAELVG